MSYSTGKSNDSFPTVKNAWVVEPVEPVKPVKPVEQIFVRDCPKTNSNSSAKKLLAQFARKTSGHGFGRLVDSDEKSAIRTFWGFVIFSFFVVLLTTIAVLTYEVFIVRQQRREFIIHHNNSMSLPDIHICDTSLFKRSALNDLGMNDTMASYMALTLSNLLASNKLKIEPNRRMELKREFDRLLNGRSINEIFEKAALKCEDIILGCVHSTVLYTSRNCCKTFFGNERYVTDLATLCVSTHHQQRLEEMFPSQLYGFTAYLKTNEKNRFEFDSSIISSNIASRRGIVYAISDPISAVNPTVSSAGHYVQLETWTSVSMTLTRTDNTELQKGLLSRQSCVPSNSHLHLVPNHSVYSKRNCVFASTRLVMESRLNCSTFRFHHIESLNVCHPDKLIDFYNAETAHAIKERADECPEDCLIDDYRVSASTTLLSLGSHDDMHVNESHSSDYVHSAIQFFFPSFSFTIIKNHPQSLIKWLSDIGGNMSIYLGASLVTLLEVLVLLGHCIWHYFY